MSRTSAAADAATSAFWFGLFLFSSVAMVLFNKAVMTSYHYSFALLMFQNGMTVLLNELGVSAAVFKREPFQQAQFVAFIIPTLIFTSMLVTSLKALPLVAVATVVVFRNVGTCLVAVGDFLIFGKQFSRDSKISLGVIVAGSLIYAYSDITFNAVGYTWVLLNTLSVVANQLYEKYAVVNMDQSAVGISTIQNILSLPVLFGFAIMFGELEAVGKFFELTFGMKFLVISTGFLGCLLSICYMSLSKFASATAITVSNNFNKVVSVIIGSLVFGTPLGGMQTLGLLVCIAGAVMFSLAGLREKKAPALPVTSTTDVKPGNK